MLLLVCVLFICLNCLLFNAKSLETVFISLLSLNLQFCVIKSYLSGRCYLKFLIGYEYFLSFGVTAQFGTPPIRACYGVHLPDYQENRLPRNHPYICLSNMLDQSIFGFPEFLYVKGCVFFLGQVLKDVSNETKQVFLSPFFCLILTLFGFNKKVRGNKVKKKGRKGKQQEGR